MGVSNYDTAITRQSDRNEVQKLDAACAYKVVGDVYHLHPFLYM